MSRKTSISFTRRHKRQESTVVDGTMIFNGKRTPVVNVKVSKHLSEHGVRDGWDADDAEIPGAHMFYPADMFTFEPSSADSGTGDNS